MRSAFDDGDSTWGDIAILIMALVLTFLSVFHSAEHVFTVLDKWGIW